MIDSADTAARLRMERRRRDEVFGSLRDGFGEPGWDMLLALCECGEDGLTKDELLSAAATAPQIAERYVEWLLAQELVVELPGAAQPLATVVLSARGRALMEQYLETNAQACGA